MSAASKDTNSSGHSKRSIRGAASQLENETKAFLQSRASLNRAASYSPTIEELQSVSFTDYVRRTILGVTTKPLECSQVTLEKVIGSIDARKYKDGIAKVTLPLGWWDEEGIRKDRTARGPEWSKESTLGQMVITTPIKQRLSGIGGIYEFTMFELKPLTVAEFRLRADEYRFRQLGPVENEFSEEAVEELVRQFWRRLGPTMEPSVYGADLEGSLFEDDNASGWNVNRLSSCLQLLTVDHPDGSLPGVTNSYLYFGMWASCFAAHTEDMNLCSINYLHAGAPKYWYSISTLDAPRFESLAAHHFADAASKCTEFLRHKRYLISPAILKKAGIKYKTHVQRPGDAIITFPGSYHFGFNIGFNVAESSNFAIPEWIPQGIHANVCLCRPDSVRIDIDRMATLLIRYEQYCLDHQYRIPYHEWATGEIERKAKELHYPHQINPNPEFLPITYPSRAKNKRQQRKTHKQESVSQVHRIAQKASAKQFKKKSQVLYYHSDGSISCGTIMEVIENHARVNFKGLSKKDDEWIPLDSAHLFLDGGVDPSSAAQNVNGNKSEKKKRKKMASNMQSSKVHVEEDDGSSDAVDMELLAPRSVEQPCQCSCVSEKSSLVPTIVLENLLGVIPSNFPK